MAALGLAFAAGLGVSPADAASAGEGSGDASAIEGISTTAVISIGCVGGAAGLASRNGDVQRDIHQSATPLDAATK